MSFDEFLLAHDVGRVLDRLGSWRPGEALGDAAHERATEWYERFAMVGGMPAVVAADVATGDPRRWANESIYWFKVGRNLVIRLGAGFYLDRMSRRSRSSKRW